MTQLRTRETASGWVNTASGVGEDREPGAATFDNRELQMCPYSCQWGPLWFCGRHQLNQPKIFLPEGQLQTLRRRVDLSFAPSALGLVDPVNSRQQLGSRALKPTMPVLRRLRQKDGHEFKARLG